MAYSCKTYPGGVPFIGVEKSMFDDPVQGPAKNCCLIASLSAVAWTMGSTRIRIATGVRGTYKVFLYTTQVSVSGALCLNENNQFHGGHSRILSEIWPGLYEKAVAKQIHGSAEECCFPDSIWDGNPNRYLNVLSGCNVPAPVSNNVPDTIISRCIGGKIKYPTVIWGSDHCYTVLGYVGQLNDQRILLRDPTGNNPTTLEGIDTSGYYLTLQNHFRYDCATGAMTSWGGYTVDLGNGIFGVHRSLLENEGELHRDNMLYYVSYAGR